MVGVAMNGACGRMGARIIDLVREDPDLALAAALERADHPAQGQDIGETLGFGSLGIAVSERLPDGADVLIDFSAPESTLSRLAECVEKKVAMVIGTTGLDEAARTEVRQAVDAIPCLLAPNMSIGVSVLLKAAADVARAVGDDCDIEIVEAHHRFKKDAPSGTALRIAESIAEAVGRDLATDAVYGREGNVGERPRREIGIHAVRTGDVVGEHTVVFGLLGERIELTHKAQSRDIFARGAVRAAKFLAGRAPGLYEIADVLRGDS